MYILALHVSLVCTGHKEASVPLQLDLQIVVSVLVRGIHTKASRLCGRAAEELKVLW